MAKILTVAVAIVAAISFASTATAAPWAEVGDAGDLPATAQVPTGTGALTSISGYLEYGFYTDMYKIFVTGGGTFSATTVGGYADDSQLFLFNSAGMGVYANDDDPADGLQSTLPASHSLTPLASGIYYLAITDIDRDPVSAGGFIFPAFPDSFGVFAPTGPGGGLPISAWDDQNYEGGDYTIYLTGAEFAPSAIPEPGTLLLLGSGLMGAAAWRRKRGEVER